MMLDLLAISRSEKLMAPMHSLAFKRAESHTASCSRFSSLRFSELGTGMRKFCSKTGLELFRWDE